MSVVFLKPLKDVSGLSKTTESSYVILLAIMSMMSLLHELNFFEKISEKKEKTDLAKKISTPIIAE